MHKNITDKDNDNLKTLDSANSNVPESLISPP